MRLRFSARDVEFRHQRLSSARRSVCTDRPPAEPSNKRFFCQRSNANLLTDCSVRIDHIDREANSSICKSILLIVEHNDVQNNLCRTHSSRHIDSSSSLAFTQSRIPKFVDRDHEPPVDSPSALFFSSSRFNATDGPYCLSRDYSWHRGTMTLIRSLSRNERTNFGRAASWLGSITSRKTDGFRRVNTRCVLNERECSRFHGEPMTNNIELIGVIDSSRTRSVCFNREKANQTDDAKSPMWATPAFASDDCFITA